MAETQEESGGEPKSAGLGARLIVVAIVLLVLVVALIFVSLGADVEGELKVAGKEYGSWVLSPSDCEAGAPEGFFGVDLSGSAAVGQVRVLQDPVEGNLVILFPPGASDRGVKVPRESCTKYTVELGHNDVWVNEVRGVVGRVQLDCPGVKGDLTFNDCY